MYVWAWTTVVHKDALARSVMPSRTRQGTDHVEPASRRGLSLRKCEPFGVSRQIVRTQLGMRAVAASWSQVSEGRRARYELSDPRIAHAIDACSASSSSSTPRDCENTDAAADGWTSACPDWGLRSADERHQFFRTGSASCRSGRYHNVSKPSSPSLKGQGHRRRP